MAVDPNDPDFWNKSIQQDADRKGIEATIREVVRSELRRELKSINERLEKLESLIGSDD